jgi:ankyrin repeat protein
MASHGQELVQPTDIPDTVLVSVAGKNLWVAVNKKNVDEVRKLCAEWGDNAEVINWAKSKQGTTPLHMAYDKPDITNILLGTASIDVNKVDDFGVTPLWKAAYNGYPKTVRFLLDAPSIDLNKAPTTNWPGGMHQGKSPLTIAQEMGNENKYYSNGCKEVVTLLNNAGALSLPVTSTGNLGDGANNNADAAASGEKGGKKKTRKSKKNKRKSRKNKSSYKRLGKR